MVRYLRAANVKDGHLDLADVQSMNFTPTEQTIFSLRPGDVLVTEGSGSLSSVGAAAVWQGELGGTVCFQNTLLRLRPRANVDGRYLAWWARSAFGSGMFASIASGANIYHLSAERVRALQIDLPSLEAQRHIADFLDAETARVDAIVAKRRKMSSLLVLKRSRVIDAELGFDGRVSKRSLTPLKYLVAKVAVGIVITPAKWYVEHGGVPALRGLNVQPGRITTRTLARISEEGDAVNSKSRLRANDIVIVRTGQVGAAAVVPASLDGANCIDLILVRPGFKLSPRYLEYVLNSDYASERVAEYSVGSIQSHFNVGAVKQLPVPSLARQQQDSIVKSLDARVEHIDQLLSKFESQDALLAERRQSLITAAVTGQIDVSTASGRGIED